MIVGIDPDSVASGVAQVCGGVITELQCLEFYDLISFLTTNKEIISLVVVEAGWLNKSNFHLFRGGKNGKKQVVGIKEAAEIGKDVGRNHQTGILIVQMCERIGIPCRIKKPLLNNVWKNNGKLFNKLTGWDGQSNPEKRDAAMLVINQRLIQ